MWRSEYGFIIICRIGSGRRAFPWMAAFPGGPARPRDGCVPRVDPRQLTAELADDGLAACPELDVIEAYSETISDTAQCIACCMFSVIFGMCLSIPP